MTFPSYIGESFLGFLGDDVLEAGLEGLGDFAAFLGEEPFFLVAILCVFV